MQRSPMNRGLMLAFLTAGLSLSASASTLYTVGFEDWQGPTSDRDFNDTVITVSGVTFHDTGIWTVPSPLQFPEEVPFPYTTAFYFDTVTATGDVDLNFVIHQTSATETAYVKVGSGGWMAITGSLDLPAFAGEDVQFRLDVNGSCCLYPAADLNPDLLPHAIEAAEAPEPNPEILIGAGLVGLYFIRRRQVA